MTANVSHMAGKVMTVRGPIDPDQLGPTLMHEHLFITLYRAFEPDDNTPATDWCLWDQELTMDKLDLARDRKLIRDNWVLVDERTAIPKLIEAGYADRVLLSQDVCTKTQLKRYGGTGYSFILEKFLPEMRSRGVSEEHIQMMMVENPKRILTFVDPQD